MEASGGSSSRLGVGARQCLGVKACLGVEARQVRELGLGTRQRSSIRGGMLHIRALVFMLHTHAYVHVAYARLCSCCIRTLVFMLHTHACAHVAVRVRTRQRS